MIKLDGNNVLIDIKVVGQSVLRGYNFDQNFVNSKGIEVYAFREVYTAGFAIPTYQLIMASTDEEYLNSFNEQNSITISIGTELNDMATYTCDTVGKAVKKDAAGTRFILNWGGVLSKDKLNSRFFKNVENGVYRGTATEALLKAWSEETGCQTDNQLGITDKGIVRDWRRTNKTLNNYLVGLYLHMDLRPSFPLVTIDGTGRLLLRDFQTMKSQGVRYTFNPDTDTVVAGQIGYTGGITVNSFKNYSNRYCGYIQRSGRDIKTGKVFTIGNSMQDAASGWGINTLATTKANENNPIEHQSSESPNVLISDITPVTFHETEIFNTSQLVNMSSIQVKVVVNNNYLSQLRVLDLVQLNTGKLDDINNGKYIVEAIEKGFVGKGQYRAIVYLCRDNFNDVEQYQADTYGKIGIKELKINPNIKAGIVNAIRNSRRSLIYIRGVMDDTYVNEYEQHLISMKRGVLSNFNMCNTAIDLNSMSRTTTSLKNAGANLVNMIINKYIAPPYSTMLYNAIFNNSTMYNLLMGLLSGVVGPAIYGELTSLIGDLKTFDTFLNNYQQTINSVQITSSPLYVEDVISGTISYTGVDTTTGVTSSSNYEITETGDNMTYTTEEKQEMVSNVVDEIIEQMPNSVDIPIPEITITDSEALQPSEQLKETIVDKIIEDLIDRGYIYDSNIIDSEGVLDGSVTGVTYMKPDGTVITAEEARRTILPSETLKQIFLGNLHFDSTSASKIQRASGTDLYVRHWGMFSGDNELASFNINSGFVEKYRTLNTTKVMSVRGGKRIYVALPAFEEGVVFYINSIKTSMQQTEYDDLGYRNNRGEPIPYIIYYTDEGYNSTNLTLEIRRTNVN